MLQTCYGEVANLLRTCYGETGAIDFGLNADGPQVYVYFKIRKLIFTKVLLTESYRVSLKFATSPCNEIWETTPHNTDITFESE